MKTDPGCVEKIISVDVLEMLSELCGKNVVNPVVEVIELIEREVKSGSVSCWTMLTRFVHGHNSYTAPVQRLFSERPLFFFSC